MGRFSPAARQRLVAAAARKTAQEAQAVSAEAQALTTQIDERLGALRASDINADWPAQLDAVQQLMGQRDRLTSKARVLNNRAERDAFAVRLEQSA